MNNDALLLLDVLVEVDVDGLGQLPSPAPQDERETKDRYQERASNNWAEDGRARRVRAVAAFSRRLTFWCWRGRRRGEGRGLQGCEGLRRARFCSFLLKSIIKI